MTLHLELPLVLQGRLAAAARKAGKPPEEYAVTVLDVGLPPATLANGQAEQPVFESEEAKRAAAIAMLNEWAEEDKNLPDEEAAANLEILRSIDENRTSYRKLFTHLFPEKQT